MCDLLGNAAFYRSAAEQNAHKVTCNVKKTIMDRVVQGIRQKLDALNVQATFISSGVGEWRCALSATFHLSL